MLNYDYLYLLVYMIVYRLVNAFESAHGVSSMSGICSDWVEIKIDFFSKLKSRDWQQQFQASHRHKIRWQQSCELPHNSETIYPLNTFNQRW